MDRRSFIRGAICSPLVIKTPNILMPVKPRLINPIEFSSDGFEGDSFSGFTQYLAREYLKRLEYHRSINRSGARLVSG